MARKESEDRSRRVRRKHLKLAEQGRPASHLGWGVRNEAEREIVREADGRVLAGQGLWTEADFGQRRELVRLVVERVRVMPSRRGARVDPAQVRLDIPLLDVAASAT